MNSFFVYAWHIDEYQKEITSIRAYGITKEGKNVCLRIDDFNPYIYLELPSSIDWTPVKAQMVLNKINDMMGKIKPLRSEFVFKRKLYYSHLDKNNQQHIQFPYLQLHFSSKTDIMIFCSKLKNSVSIQKIGILKLKPHEQKASPILQLICTRGLPSAGWILFKGLPVNDEDKLTNCDREFKVACKNLSKMETEDLVSPLVMCYDIEVYSSNPNKMPTETNPRDKIFQMSCVFFRVGDDETKYEKYLYSLGEPDSATVGADVNVFSCANEAQLIESYADIINEKQPNIICGYNIFKFDIPYMITRSKTICNVFNIFNKHGFNKYGNASEKTIKWSSSAYGDQEYAYLDAEGRLLIDLMPQIQRDYKFSSYALKSVSEHFIGETKDPLKPKDIFKSYEIGMKDAVNGPVALGTVGKYCVQDSVLVAKLFNKLLIWYNLSEFARICNVSIFTLHTQGQQIRVYSQVYKKCISENVVVECDVCTPSNNDRYQGAFVFEPVPGVYDCVVPFDFASLYPSIIIAYNIDFSTLVPFDSQIPDELCNVIEWDEHIGCTHDTSKSKPKNILCGHHKFKFIKNIAGILPSMLVDLLEARKKTRAIMKDLKDKIKICTVDSEKQSMEILYEVLNKRQLSQKTASNSAYGTLGARVGYLPLMPGAMCVTAIGRQSILRVANVITNQYGARIILGDTDSVYCVFDALKTDTCKIWEYCEKVSAEISKLFPKPMKLEFEGVIYWRFLTLTKKRYMSLKCDKTGEVSRTIEKKGVLLTRRDNSNFVRTVYADIIMQVFDKALKDDILYSIIQYFNNLCANNITKRDFVITKSVGPVAKNQNGEFVVTPFSKDKGMLGKYKVPLLAEEGTAKYEQQMKLKNTTNANVYYLRCLPSQVQLAEKIRGRGQRVDDGTRLEFVVLSCDEPKAKLYSKIEQWEYFRDHSAVLHVDFMYYLKAIALQLDQVLVCTVGVEDFGKTQVKLRIQKEKVIAQLNQIFQPKLLFE